MQMDQIKTAQEQLSNYRNAIKEATAELHEAEAELEKEQAGLIAFEQVVDAHLKPLMDHLNLLEEEIEAHTIELLRRQARSVYDDGYPTIEEQLHQKNENLSDPALSSQPISLQLTEKKELKQIYRLLARRYHPDLASDDDEKARRNEKMAAINDAYAAGSVVEMVTLSKASSDKSARMHEHETTQEILLRALEKELYQIRQRIQEVEIEKRNLHNHPMVQLSLQTKLARCEGRNLLREMASELELDLELKMNDLNRLKAQIENPRSQPSTTSTKKPLSSLTRRLLGNPLDAPLNPRLRGSY